MEIKKALDQALTLILAAVVGVLLVLFILAIAYLLKVVV